MRHTCCIADGIGDGVDLGSDARYRVVEVIDIEALEGEYTRSELPHEWTNHARGDCRLLIAEVHRLREKVRVLSEDNTLAAERINTLTNMFAKANADRAESMERVALLRSGGVP